jgi:basic membrane protein A and related proteins
MRLKRLWALMALLAIVVLVVGAGCGDDDDDSGGGGDSGGSSESSGGGEAKIDKIALLTPGTGDDGSWGQAVSEGAKEYGEKYGASQVEIAENLDTPDQYEQQATAFAQAGFDLVVLANGSVQQATQRSAQQYPDTLFGEIAVEEGALAENISAANGKWQNGTFLAGIVAAMMTETNKLATIGGFDFPALTSEMEGFVLGARYVNPDITFQRTYINSWTDTGKARAAAEAQQSRGADIIFSATDQATQGIFQLAQGGGTLKYVIPQYFNKCDQAPDVVLTSVLYNLQGIVGRFVEMAAEDTWKNEFVELGLDFGVGTLEYCEGTESDIPDDVKKAVEDASKKITDGTLVVPGLDEIGKSGSADDIDPKSLEQ